MKHAPRFDPEATNPIPLDGEVICAPCYAAGHPCCCDLEELGRAVEKRIEVLTRPRPKPRDLSGAAIVVLLVAAALCLVAAAATAEPHRMEADAVFTLCATPPGSTGAPCSFTRPAYLVVGPVVLTGDIIPPQNLRYRVASVQLLTGDVGSTCDSDPEFTAYAETGSVADGSNCPPAPKVAFTPSNALPPVSVVLVGPGFTRTATVYFGRANHALGKGRWVRSGVVFFALVHNPRDCDGDPTGNVGMAGFQNAGVCP